MATADNRFTAFALPLLFISFCLPVPFRFAGVQLSPERIVVIVLSLPVLFRWLTGAAGRITFADVLFVLFGLWMIVTLTVNNGIEKLPYAIILMMETVGSYFIGRVLIRSEADYRLMFRYFFMMLFCLLPFVIPELMTGKAYYLQTIRTMFGSTFGDLNFDLRWGLSRVQASFEHPIEFGIFCSLGIANGLYLWRGQLKKALGYSGFALFMTFTSLSSGALLAGMLQMLITLWGKITRDRWVMLTSIGAALFVFLEFASNRGPIILIIDTLTFNSSTGWTRVKIYEYGSAEVARHPIFGIGLNDWIRPGWLGASVDNFWLLTAMRHGLVGFGLLVLAIAVLMFGIMRARRLPIAISYLRTGYLIALLSMCFTLTTVHVWGPTGIFVMIYIGAGSWFSDVGPRLLEENMGPRDRRRAKEAAFQDQAAGVPAETRTPLTAAADRFSRRARWPSNLQESK